MTLANTFPKGVSLSDEFLFSYVWKTTVGLYIAEMVHLGFGSWKFRISYKWKPLSHHVGVKPDGFQVIE